MTNYTDEQIVKALEKWVKNFDGRLHNYAKLVDAIALINRQKKTIAKHEAYIDNLNDDKASLFEEIIKKDAEIEEWKTIAEGYQKQYEEHCDRLVAERDEWAKRFCEMHEVAEVKQKQANAEIERLNTALERLADESDARDIDDTFAVEKIRTDAINEFAERVKVYYSKPKYQPTKEHPIKHTMVEHLLFVIDQIAKETKGEQGNGK